MAKDRGEGDRKQMECKGKTPQNSKSQILLNACTLGSSFGRMNDNFFFLELSMIFPSFPLFLHLCTAFGITEKTKLITKKGLDFFKMFYSQL